jgi:putative FmdB family regulatory protein
MPTYEYECLECKHRFSVFQSITEDAVENCEKCGKSVRKVFGAAGIIFKGEGFYVNDYKNSSNSTAKANNSANKKNENNSPCSSCESCPSAN